MLKKVAKKNIEPKKYVILMIVGVLFLSALSVWCIIPNSTMKLSNNNGTDIECYAQGDYTPQPLETTEMALVEVEDDPIILCGAMGDYKPRPLKPKPKPTSSDD